MQLALDNTADFLRCFYSFQDGVIRRFEYTYGWGQTHQAHARVTVSTQQASEVNAQEPVLEKWVNIVLDFQGVTEFAWAEGEEVQLQVIYWDLHIRHWNNQVYIDFGGLENSIAEKLVSAENDIVNFRLSKVYIAAHSVTWNMLPYQEP